MSTPSPIATPTRSRRHRVWRWVFALALVTACVGFLALGAWQWQRMSWKHELIARVQERIHVEPVAIPERARWPHVNAADDEYRKVRSSGRFLDDAPTQVQAVTEHGAGWWLLAPFATDDGDIVLVNRGFIAHGVESAPAPSGPQVVTGLLRLTEPDGAFLRRNDPATSRWYSRDVAAIAAARALSSASVAPFFIDADSTTSAGTNPDEPLGGLTVVRFRDSHLSYALTWFALAGLSLLGIWLVLSAERGLRQHGDSHRNTLPAHDGPTTPDQ